VLVAAALQTNKTTTVTRDTVALLLEGKSIPPNGFLHLYDSTPYMMNAGYIVLHIPCDSSSKPIVNVLIGQAPNLKPIEPELVKELSQPGNMCIYHVDINSDPAKQVYQTDVAIQNPAKQTITFPPSSGVVIGVNEVQPSVPGGSTKKDGTNRFKIKTKKMRVKQKSHHPLCFKEER
jgi:hypothetical protein